MLFSVCELRLSVSRNVPQIETFYTGGLQSSVLEGIERLFYPLPGRSAEQYF